MIDIMDNRQQQCVWVQDMIIFSYIHHDIIFVYVYPCDWLGSLLIIIKMIGLSMHIPLLMCSHDINNDSCIEKTIIGMILGRELNIDLVHVALHIEVS